jgi:hypothetical protein
MVESYCPCSGAWEASFANDILPAVGSIVTLSRVFDAAAAGTQGCCRPSAVHDSSVSCMHSLTECTADRLQRCTQEKYPDWQTYLDYTVCIQGECRRSKDALGCETQFVVGMDSNKQREMDCAKNMTLDYDAISECWSGREGIDLMESEADRSDEIAEKVGLYGLKGLPLVLIDGELFSSFFDCDASSEKYVEDLIGAICAAFDGGEDAPAACI